MHRTWVLLRSKSVSRRPLVLAAVLAALAWCDLAVAQTDVPAPEMEMPAPTPVVATPARPAGQLGVSASLEREAAKAVDASHSASEARSTQTAPAREPASAVDPAAASAFEPAAASGVDPSVAAALPEVDVHAPEGGYHGEIERAWFGAGRQPSARAIQTRIRALEIGVDNAEAAARALISPNAVGVGVDELRTAARLAPDLPLVRMTLARALWDEGERVPAVIQVFAGLAAIPFHLEASLWLVGSLLIMFAAVLVLGAMAFMVATGASLYRHAAHDLGDLLSNSMPTFARAALLGCVVLLPVVLGEGALGLVMVLFMVGYLYGTARHRMALSLAAALLIIGLYPVARFANIALDSLESDPVAEAALAVARGIESPAELALLESAGGDDLMAHYALADHARRMGDTAGAREQYELLLTRNAADPVLLTNIANWHFRAGDPDKAIQYYERAIALGDSPVILFNLAQAYARAFKMEKYEPAMEKAQSMDREAVAELSNAGDSSYVADLPHPVGRIRNRLVLAAFHGADATRPYVRLIAPGHLGNGWPMLAGAFAAVALVSVALSGRYEQASNCNRCGRRICGRCDGTVWSNKTCESCYRLFNRPETTDTALRMNRLGALRAREARLDKLATVVSFIVPGAGGLLAQRPDLSFIGILLCVWAMLSFLWRGGVVPDPLAVGAAGPLAFSIAGVIALLGYLSVVLMGLIARRNL